MHSNFIILVGIGPDPQGLTQGSGLGPDTRIRHEVEGVGHALFSVLEK